MDNDTAIEDNVNVTTMVTATGWVPKQSTHYYVNTEEPNDLVIILSITFILLAFIITLMIIIDYHTPLSSITLSHYHIITSH